MAVIQVMPRLPVDTNFRQSVSTKFKMSKLPSVLHKNFNFVDPPDVIHTVGPRGEKQDVLRSCYRRCFEVLLENNLKTIVSCIEFCHFCQFLNCDSYSQAFPCISTGIFGKPIFRHA